MRLRFLAFAVCSALFLCLPGAWTQDALLSNRDAVQLYGRAVNLMDSTKVVVPELARAGEPLAENARQALATMKVTSPQDSRLTYTFLTNLRAYVVLADSLPKPYPFPEEPRKQFYELRDTLDRVQSQFRALLNRKEAELRNPDRDNLKRYAEANKNLIPPQADNPRVVFLGDSITDSWRLNEYFPERDFVNRGISGQITGQMLGRMKADVIDLKPSAILVLGGTNDIARGVPVSTIQENLTMIGDLADAHNIKPLFASLLPVSDYHKDSNPSYERTKLRPPATISALNEWLRSFCRQRKYTYIDYYSQLVDTNGFLKGDLSDDGLHPNSAGYRLMAPLAFQAIDSVVKAPPPRKKRRLWPF
jgi:lysophospholipase L1-like esterase